MSSTDGFYYFTATMPTYDRIVLRRATTIRGLTSATETTIWTKHTTGEMGGYIWAPEIHFIDGKWHIDVSDAYPITGTWTEQGRIALPLDTFSLGPTAFAVNGTRYLARVQNPPPLCCVQRGCTATVCAIDARPPSRWVLGTGSSP